MNQPSVAASVHPDASRALTNRWPPGPLVMAHLRRDETYAALLPDSRSAPRPSTAACGRRSSCSRRWRRPRPSRSRSRADRAPLHGRTRQPFNLMGHIFLNVHERTKDIS